MNELLGIILLGITLVGITGGMLFYERLRTKWYKQQFKPEVEHDG